MPVDKFGLMSDGNEVSIQPINRYAQNLDDLENVEGWTEEGEENKVYAFKLQGNGIYKRSEIPTANFDIPYDKEEDINTAFVLAQNKGKWVAIPFKQDWEIDIKLENDKVISRGENHNVRKVLNSGKMMLSLVVVKVGDVNVVYKKNDYFLHTVSSKAVLSFNVEFREEMQTLPDLYSIIIEGHVNEVSNGHLDLFPGLKVEFKDKNTRFQIAIHKTNTKTKVVKFPKSLDVDLDEPNFSLRNLYLHKHFDVNRFRYSITKVSKSDILFH